MTPTRPLLATLLTLATATVAAQDALQYRRDILRPGAGDAVTLVPLDAAIHAATRDGWPDVRIVDDGGVEVPYSLQVDTRSREVADREEVPSRVVSLQVVEGDALEVITSVEGDAPAPDGATIRTPLTDFERRVRVFGSNDGREWEPLADGRIFDYSRYMDVRDVEVRFPARGHRSFKWVFEQESDERRSPFYELTRTRGRGGREGTSEVETILRRPFRIDRIALHRSVSRSVGEEAATTRFPLPVLNVQVDRGERVTRVGVAAGRLPLSRVSIATSSRNFQRPVRVQRPADGDWIDVARGTISLYQIEGLRRESLGLDIPETRVDRLRLVIEDGDNPPLDVTHVEGEAVDHRLAFVADAGRSYRLEYGSDALHAPRYDAAAVLAALGDAPRETAGLGPARPNPDYRHGGRPTRVDRSPWLILALALMTVILAWAVFQAVRRADKRELGEFD